MFLQSLQKHHNCHSLLKGKHTYILSKLGKKNLLLTVNKDKQLLSQPAQQPIRDNQLWMVDQIQPDEYYLISEAGDLFSDKGKSAYITSNEGSGVALYGQGRRHRGGRGGHGRPTF